MRIRMHFPNLRSADQDVSSSSQQLCEPCFLVRLAGKQQFIHFAGHFGTDNKTFPMQRGDSLNINHSLPATWQGSDGEPLHS